MAPAMCALGHERLARLVAYHSSARWEAEHLVVQCLHCAHDYLAGTVERTEERIWAAGGRA
jgi:hypothetical protein